MNTKILASVYRQAHTHMYIIFKEWYNSFFFLISYSKNSLDFISKRKISHYFKIYNISWVKFQVVFQFLFTVFLDLPLHAVFSSRHTANFCICHLVSKMGSLIIFKAFCLSVVTLKLGTSGSSHEGMDLEPSFKSKLNNYQYLISGSFRIH